MYAYRTTDWTSSRRAPKRATWSIKPSLPWQPNYKCGRRLSSRRSPWMPNRPKRKRHPRRAARTQRPRNVVARDSTNGTESFRFPIQHGGFVLLFEPCKCSSSYNVCFGFLQKACLLFLSTNRAGNVFQRFPEWPFVQHSNNLLTSSCNLVCWTNASYRGIAKRITVCVGLFCRPFTFYEHDKALGLANFAIVIITSHTQLVTSWELK